MTNHEIINRPGDISAFDLVGRLLTVRGEFGMRLSELSPGRYELAMDQPVTRDLTILIEQRLREQGLQCAFDFAAGPVPGQPEPWRAEFPCRWEA